MKHLTWVLVRAVMVMVMRGRRGRVAAVTTGVVVVVATAVATCVALKRNTKTIRNVLF